MLPFKDGFITINSYKIYYKIVGEQTNKKKLPLLVVAGGPGSPHNYLLDLQQLARSGRQVVFYDQLGCGKSDLPKDDSIYQVETYVNEINSLRRALKLNHLHMLGHSWGGMLAIDYLLTKPEGIESITLASTIISVPLFKEEMDKLRTKLPKPVNTTLTKHESQNTVDDQEYKQAYAIFSKKHIFLGDSWPPHLSSPPNSFGTKVYRKMWGLSETFPNGSLKKWDRIKDLNKIAVHTLITSGKFDEVTPRQALLTKANIKRSTQIFFDYSGHMPHVDEPSKYREVLEQFLQNVEDKLEISR